MKAFTLIETVLYIALLGFIMTSSLMTIYAISQNEGFFTAKTVTQDEGNFVLSKLDWALDSLDSIVTPATGYAHTLTILKADGTQIDVRRNNGKIEMRVGTLGTYTALTTANASTTSLSFLYLTGQPAGIEASTTINGVTFTTRRYLRK